MRGTTSRTDEQASDSWLFRVYLVALLIAGPSLVMFLMWLFPSPGPSGPIILYSILFLWAVILLMWVGVVAKMSPKVKYKKSRVHIYFFVSLGTGVLLSTHLFNLSNESISGNLFRARMAWHDYASIRIEQLATGGRYHSAAALHKFQSVIPAELLSISVSTGQFVTTDPCRSDHQNELASERYLVTTDTESTRPLHPSITHIDNQFEATIGECLIVLELDELDFCPDDGFGTTSRSFSGPKDSSVWVSCLDLEPEGGMAQLLYWALDLKD